MSNRLDHFTPAGAAFARVVRTVETLAPADIGDPRISERRRILMRLPYARMDERAKLQQRLNDIEWQWFNEGKRAP